MTPDAELLAELELLASGFDLHGLPHNSHLVLRARDRLREMAEERDALERVVKSSANDCDVWVAKTEAAESQLAAVTTERDKLTTDRNEWKRHADMLANAWAREICQQGILYRSKAYWIDFMVLATRKVMDLAKENGVTCCGTPEICANEHCNRLLRTRIAARGERTDG